MVGGESPSMKGLIWTLPKLAMGAYRCISLIRLRMPGRDFSSSQVGMRSGPTTRSSSVSWIVRKDHQTRRISSRFQRARVIIFS